MKDGTVELLIGGSVGIAMFATTWWVVKGNPGPLSGIAVMLALWAIIAILLRKPVSDPVSEEIAQLRSKNAKLEMAVDTMMHTAMEREIARLDAQIDALKQQVQP